jgi:hypothetical protein
MGPHYANFRAITDEPAGARGRCASPPRRRAGRSADRVAARPDGAEAMGERARQVFDQQAGATGAAWRRCGNAAISRLDGGAPVMSPLFAAQAAAAAGSGSTGWRWRCANLRLRTGLEPVRRLRWPVVSIGNLSTGGAGKTPLTIALAKALERAACAWTCSRAAMGAAASAPPALALDGTAEEFGDEPLLIARETGVPVYVAAQRLRGRFAGRGWTAPRICALVCTFWTTVFSIASLHRDVDILLLDGRDWRTACCRRAICASRSRPPAAPPVIAIPAPGDDPELEEPSARLGLGRAGLAAAAQDGGSGRRWSPWLRSAASPARSSSSPASKPPACKSPPASPSPTTTAIPCATWIAWSPRPARREPPPSSPPRRIRFGWGSSAAAFPESTAAQDRRPAHRD